MEINTNKLEEIYKEWRGNASCYDNGRPVFEADELLDFAGFCLKHESNIQPVAKSLPEYNEILYHARILTDEQFREYWNEIQGNVL